MRHASNETAYISPITLDHAWSKQDRLLVTVVCSIFGCLMNGFFIAAFFINDYLKRIGLVFQASVGLADMIVSMGVIPVSAYALLSGVGDSANVCYALQFLIEASTYSYSVFFAMMTAETYFRMCRPRREYEQFISKRIDLIAIIVLAISFIFAGIGTYNGLDYDTCYRSHSGNRFYRAITNFAIHFVSCLITLFCSVSSGLEMLYRANTDAHYRRSRQYDLDRQSHCANTIAYVLFVGAWLPFMSSVNSYPEANDSKFYYRLWLGVGRSAITSSVYGVLDRNFKRAYGRLFGYLFCKKAISGRVVRRHRRAVQYRAEAGNVTFSMMHHAINTHSPFRTALYPRSP